MDPRSTRNDTNRYEKGKLCLSFGRATRLKTCQGSTRNPKSLLRGGAATILMVYQDASMEGEMSSFDVYGIQAFKGARWSHLRAPLSGGLVPNIISASQSSQATTKQAASGRHVRAPTSKALDARKPHTRAGLCTRKLREGAHVQLSSTSVSCDGAKVAW